MKKSVFLLALFWIHSVSIYSQFFSDNCSGGKNILPIQDVNFCNNSEWVLVLEDNFNVDSLDLSKWKNIPYPGSLQGGTDQNVVTLRNAVVEEGILNLIAKHEHVQDLVITYLDSNEILSDGLPNYRWFEYTASLIQSTQKFCYGYFEASCKISTGKGIGSAMWMFGDYKDQYNNIIQQEIDVFEIAENNQKVLNMNVHHDGDVCSQKHNGPDYSKSFHTYGLLWEQYKIEWYVDGELIRRYPRYFQNGSDVGCKLNAWQPYQEAPFPKDSIGLLFNISVDNREGNKPDDTTPFPSKFQIDWVRYYVRKDILNSTKLMPLNSMVYPNPNQGTVTVEVNEDFSGKVSVKLLSIQFIPVFEKNLPGSINPIDISFLENGLYFILVENTETHQRNFHKILICK